MPQNLEFLRRAIQLARKGMRANAGGPFGAVVVYQDQIIGQGWNQVTSTNDPTAHAEIVAIRDACRHLGSFQLTDCVIYTSCEPCPMCLGAIFWARPTAFVYAATYADAAEGGFDDDHIYEEIHLPAADRRIPGIQALREEGLQLFSEWRAKDDKEAY